MRASFIASTLTVAHAVPTTRTDCCATLRSSLPDSVFYSGSPSYQASLTSYWAFQETALHPSCIVAVHTTAHVQTAVIALAKINSNTTICPFAVRAGGHGKNEVSVQNGGVTIDLSALNHVSVSNDGRETAIGVGAQWGNVAAVLGPMNLTVPGGRDATVGVGGLSLAGGILYFLPKTGFTVDNIVAYEIVLSDGRVVNASRHSHSDLYRSLRGGGNNFGIVTRIIMQTLRQGQMWGGTTYYDISTADSQLQAFFEFVNDSDYDVRAYSYQSFGFSSAAMVALNNFAYSEPTAGLPTKIQALNNAGPALFSTLQVTNLTELIADQAAESPAGFRQLTYTLTFKLSLDMLRSSFAIWNATLPAIKSVANITYSWTTEPLPLAALQASRTRGPNIMGVAESNVSLVLCLLSASYSKASDDSLMWATAKQVIADVETKAKAANAYHPWKYMGYAAKGQDVIAAYGADNRAFITATSLAYDNERLFQKAVRGGFKL